MIGRIRRMTVPNEKSRRRRKTPAAQDRQRMRRADLLAFHHLLDPGGNHFHAPPALGTVLRNPLRIRERRR